MKEALALIPEQRAVVFMPYKSSMWDCMESVWQAACEDSDCVPYVVPIPYLDGILDTGNKIPLFLIIVITLSHSFLIGNSPVVMG